jgi:hypothetical protein
VDEDEVAGKERIGGVVVVAGWAGRVTVRGASWCSASGQPPKSRQS